MGYIYEAMVMKLYAPIGRKKLHECSVNATGMKE